MKYISCINVRLAHEIQGCAEEVLPYIQTREQIMHTLIVSPPDVEDHASSGYHPADE